LFSVLGLIVLIWLLLERRRTILLHIDNKELRKEAETAMLAFIDSRRDRIWGGQLARRNNAASHGRGPV
jgi:hypothetical protein